jgi:precorrin-2 dehydrogenase/sirohydrochlorin ferrochelatase
LLKSSPNANVEVVAPRFYLVDLINKHDSVKLTMKKFKKMLKKRHMVIACTDDLEVNKRIELCRDRYLICNIADTPELCDYYLGGIVTKGM